MNVSKKITSPVEGGIKELNKALREACFALLPKLGDECAIIRLEKPISLVNAKVREDKNESSVNVAVARYISYVLPYEGMSNSGFYILYSERCDADYTMVSSDIYLTLENKIKVYEMLKTMVRHK
jgi:hypothetical protein